MRLHCRAAVLLKEDEKIAGKVSTSRFSMTKPAVPSEILVDSIHQAAM
jgi:hypothetical protein